MDLVRFESENVSVMQRPVALGLAGLGWAIAVCGSSWHLLYGDLTYPERWAAGFSVVLPTVGALVAIRRPKHPIGWIMLAGSICMLSTSAVAYAGIAWAERGGGFAATLLIWSGHAAFAGTILIAIHLPLRFPDGRLPGPRWRWVSGLAHLGSAAVAVPLLLEPGPLRLFENPGQRLPFDNPLGIAWAGPVAGPLALGGTVLLAIAGIAALASLIFRWRRGSEAERLQLRWLLLAVGLAAAFRVFFWITEVLGGPADHGATVAYATALMVLFPGAVGVAVLRYRALDIDRLIRRSLVFGLLWLAIAAAYVGVAVGMGMAAGSRLPVGVAVALTVGVTLAFAPARRLLEAVADRWVFGPRRAPPDLLTEFGTSLDGGGRPEEIGSSLARTLIEGLRLSWAEVAIEGSPACVLGQPDSEVVVTVPIAQNGQYFGVIRCGPPEDLRTLEDPDIALLKALAFQAALALHATRLAARLVGAQAEERRRIERNIHDGAQQELVALMARLGVAEQELAGTGAQPILAALKAELAAIMADLRALAQGIHPPALDDSGMVEAIAQRLDGLPLEVHLEVEPELERHRLAPEVEEVAYFVVSEALSNILKHAAAGRVKVALRRAEGRLVIIVEDDGYGFPGPPTTGSGLPGLSDRLGALGGSLSVQSRPGEGTKIEATLPLQPTGVTHG